MNDEYPWDDVIGCYLETDMVVELAKGPYLDRLSNVDNLAWVLLLGWCPVLDVQVVEELFLDV